MPALGRERPPGGADGKVLRGWRLFCRPLVRERGAYFSELYSVPEEIRKGYFKVKVLELLLFLSALPTERRRPAYSGAQVRLASAVSEYLLSATEERPHGGALQSSTPRPRRYCRACRAFTACLRRRFCALRENARRGGGFFVPPTGRCSISPGSSDTTTPANLPVRFRSVIGVSPRRLPQRRDRRQLRAGLIQIPTQKQHFGAAFAAHFGADAALPLPASVDNLANRETLPRMYAFPPCHIISHPFVRCGPEGGAHECLKK